MNNFAFQHIRTTPALVEAQKPVSTFQSYADLETRIISAPLRCSVLESYSGSSIVRWWGNIERQILSYIKDYEGGRNMPYVTKLETFLRIWREYPIQGSINREQIDPLIAASTTLAVDGWRLGHYFGTLRDELRVLVASEEELPRGEYEQPEAPKGGLAGQAPISDFGPQDEAPGEGGDKEGGALDADTEDSGPGGEEGGALDAPTNITQGNFGGGAAGSRLRKAA